MLDNVTSKHAQCWLCHQGTTQDMVCLVNLYHLQLTGADCNSYFHYFCVLFSKCKQDGLDQQGLKVFPFSAKMNNNVL